VEIERKFIINNIENVPFKLKESRGKIIEQFYLPYNIVALKMETIKTVKKAGFQVGVLFFNLKLPDYYKFFNRDIETRVRKIKDKSGVSYCLTFKTYGDLIRFEKEIILTKKQFNLLKTYANKHIRKTRFVVKNSDNTIFEIDFYLNGLSILEVEFPDEKSALSFTPPPWVGKEVTNNSSFKNYNLASQVVVNNVGDLQRQEV
jgi:adenylate cyclase